MKKVALHNLGCKVNSYEIEAMQQMLEKEGYEIVPFEPGADIYVINTCTVTNIADRKSRQMLHKAKKMNPDAIVVATGCYVQMDTEKAEADPAVDLILGNNQKKNIVEVLKEYERENIRKSHVIKINQTHEYEELSISQTAEHVRAYIKVQDGCNQFCTYCIIPYARGRVRSRQLESVLKEVQGLAAKGYKEVVLTGIHLGSYGTDFSEDQKESLLTLIKKVHEIDGIERIRLGSLEPGIMTEAFIQEISKLYKICPHFHLSLQSGCDNTLEKMNRKYRTEDFSRSCELLRKYFEAPALTTDIIVGFPGETEEDHQKSYDFVKGIRFYETHIFPYSRRKGTKAAVMEGQLTEAVKKQRSETMIEMHHRHAKAYEEQMLGKILEVLLEEEVNYGDKTYYLGHSKEYLKVAVQKKEEYHVNDILKIKAAEFLEEHILLGQIVEEK